MKQGPAFLYGESLFMTLCVWQGKILFKNQQLERLLDGLSEYYQIKDLGEEELAILESRLDRFLMEYSSLKSATFALRMTCYLDQRDGLLFNSIGFKDIYTSFNMRKFTQFDSLSVGLAPSPFTLDYPKLKMGSYMPHLYFKSQAKLVGHDDCLFYLENNFIELSTSNIFFVKDGKITTPSGVIYEGLTRRNLLNIVDIELREIKLNELNDFDYAFSTNSVSIVNGISQIDEIKYQVDLEFLEKLRRELLKVGLNEKSS